ncbi:MAG: hypothetical protein DLM61_20310 [Pseudonocardiales bacterium]|nr:MerR family DNA-binding transcriptional regulator [Pseudonocardiales bacterium]PZS25234.1 MAG: hypothetical protein DLM61_20310 [Pseudonocardiales bacterium]
MHARAAGRAGSEPTWRIGQLADATGLSVRTLRHYDARGPLIRGSYSRDSCRAGTTKPAPASDLSPPDRS